MLCGVGYVLIYELLVTQEPEYRTNAAVDSSDEESVAEDEDATAERRR